MQEAALEACMAKNGFRYEPIPFQPVDLGLGGRYGVDQMDRQPPPVDGAQENSGVKGLGEADRSAWEDVFFGEELVTEQVGFGGALGLPSDGCLAEARGEADPRWREREKVSFQLNMLMGESLARSEDDPRVDQAMKGWLSCMADRAQPVAGLEDAAGRAFAGDEAVGAASASCNGASNLPGIWREADLAAQEQLLRENPAVAAAAGGLRP